MELPRRKHLKHPETLLLDYHTSIFFITMTTYQRRKVFADPLVADEVIECLMQCNEMHGWAIGRFVIMPDHIHFFAVPVKDAKALSGFIRDFKKWMHKKSVEAGYEGKLWQNEFFDRLLRRNESYHDKWKCMLDNPVRTGLCERAEDWPYQGEISLFEYKRVSG